MRPGIEVLLTDSLPLVAGRRVGLLTNQTGVDRAGVSDVDRLVAGGVQLTTIFSPEHGYRGMRDDEQIEHGVDSATGLPIFSLYGGVRTPTPEMLGDVDVLLIDLQDIGARPYTFITTALDAMRAAQVEGLPVLVLDRPNPIGGAQVQGPVLDLAHASYVGRLPVPLRHGMTLGELALLGNHVLQLGADLTVVPADGWRREAWFDATGLPWVRPSPNMPDLESATHYPGTVLFEATNLSVGRGTPVAFRAIGAPWLDAHAAAEALQRIPGVLAVDTVITPDSPPDGRFPGQTIPAVLLRVVDRAAYDPTALAVVLLDALWRLHRDSLTVDRDRLARLAGDGALWDAVRGGAPTDSIRAAWVRTAEQFRATAAPYLLYR